MNLADIRDQLIRDEGLRLKPYTDTSGKLTIGIGRNLTDKGISRAEAIALLDNDIAEHSALLDKYLPWWGQLDDARSTALLNMAFNMGVGPSDEQPTGKLLNFHDTLKAFQGGDYNVVANHLSVSLWAKQVGERATRIIATIRGNSTGDIA